MKYKAEAIVLVSIVLFSLYSLMNFKSDLPSGVNVPKGLPLGVAVLSGSLASASTSSTSSSESDDVYRKNLRHIGLLSADSDYVWCGSDGKLSLEEGYGNQSQSIPGADPKSLVKLDLQAEYPNYYRDWKAVYFSGVYEGKQCNTVAGADIDTFRVILGPFATDAYRVYAWGGARLPVDVPSFALLKKNFETDPTGNQYLSRVYFTDKNSVYIWYADIPWKLFVLQGAQPEKFRVPENGVHPYEEMPLEAY